MGFDLAGSLLFFLFFAKSFGKEVGSRFLEIEEVGTGHHICAPAFLCFYFRFALAINLVIR